MSHSIRHAQKTFMSNKIDFKSRTLFSARSENAHVKEDWPQVSNSTRHAHKTLINLTCQVRMTYRSLFGALRKRTSQLRLTTSLRVRSFGRIRIRISDMWRSVWANPFSDQWSIKSTLDLTLDLTLDKDSSDNQCARSKDGSLHHWSNVFLWAKDPKLIILLSDAQFQTSRYFICWPERLLAIAQQILR